MSRIATATLAEGIPQVVYKAAKDEWIKLTVIQTGNAAGQVLLTTQGGKPTTGNSFQLPVNVPILIDMSPGDTLTAMSNGDQRQLSIWITPDVIAQLDEMIDAKIRNFFGKAVDKYAPPEEMSEEITESLGPRFQREKKRAEAILANRLSSFRRRPP